MARLYGSRLRPQPRSRPPRHRRTRAAAARKRPVHQGRAGPRECARNRHSRCRHGSRTGAPWCRASSSNLVVRHAYGKIKLTAAGSLLGGGEGADKLLAADATWALAPPRSQRAVDAPGAVAGVTAAGAALSRATHRATLSIRVGERPLELSFELFGRVVPKTVDNFVRLCRGSGGDGGGGGGANARRYAGTRLQRVIPGFMAQGGATDGGYGEGADGGKFPTSRSR